MNCSTIHTGELFSIWKGLEHVWSHQLKKVKIIWVLMAKSPSVYQGRAIITTDLHLEYIPSIQRSIKHSI